MPLEAVAEKLSQPLSQPLSQLLKAHMHIIWTILIGFVAGLLARAILPGNNSMGFFLTAILGIAGSLIATYLGQFAGWYAAGAGAGFIASVIGAVVLLAVAHLVMRKS